MISSEMCLSQQVDIFKEAFENNANVQNLQKKISDTRVMNDKFSTCVNSLRTLAISYQILRGYSYAGTIFLDSESLKGRFLHAQDLLDKVRNVWQGKKELLRQDESFSDLLSHLEVCCNELKDHLQQNWYKYVDSWKNGFDVPQMLLKEIANIPGQTELCSAYFDLMAKFNQLIKSLPQQKETLGLIERYVEQLTKLKAKMQFDIPENVKLFFANFKNSIDTVSLQLLTPEVFEWLHKKQLLNSFSVQRNWNNP